MSDAKLGTKLNGSGQRDAIHVAITPVVAGEELEPGQHVGLADAIYDTDKIVVFAKPKGQCIGIIDPYLTELVKQGEECYLCLYPGTVTSLRHEWEHPAFKAAPATDRDSKEFSEQWLRMYAAKINSYDDDPNVAFANLIDDLKRGEIFARGSDLHSFGELDDSYGLKLHAERYLGIKINWEDYSFTCSC